MGRYRYAIKVVGFGDATAATATDKLYRIATGPIASDPDGLYISGALVGYPKEINLEVALLDALVEGGQATFELGGKRTTFAQVVAGLGRYDDGVNTALGSLTDDISASDTVVPTTTSGLDGTVIYIGLEAILLGTEIGSTGSYTACTRGVLRTLAQAHQVSGDRYIFGHMHVVPGRVMELIRVPVGGGYSNEQRLWLGAVQRRQDLTRSGMKIIGRHLLSFLEQVKLCGPERFRAEVVSGTWRSGSAIGKAGGPASADGHLPTAGTSGSPYFLICIDGKVAHLAKWAEIGDGLVHVSWGPSIGSLPVLANIDNVDLDEEIPVGTGCWEWFTPNTDIQSQIVNRTTGGASYWSRKPIPWLRAILTTTPGGGNGSSDYGARTVGAFLDEDLLDTASWDAAAARFDDARISGMNLGFDGKAVPFGDVVKAVLRPLHAGLGQTGDGISIVTYRDAIPYEGADATVTQADHVGARSNPAGLDCNDDAGLDDVNVKARDYLTGKEVPVESDDRIRQERYPYSGASEIEIDASAYSQAPQVAARVATDIAEAYRSPPPILPVKLRAELDLWPGKIVDYTHPDVWDTTGTTVRLGLTNAAMMVVGRKLVLGERDEHYSVQAQLALTGKGLRRVGHIANAVKVLSYTDPGASASGRHEVVVDRDAFKAEGSDPLSPDSTPFTAGQSLSVVDYDLARKGANYENVELYAITENTPSAGQDLLEFRGTVTWLSPLVAGDIIRYGTEGSTNAPTDTFAFLAPSSGNFASGREPFQYVVDVTPREGSSPWSGFEVIDDDGATDEWPLDEAILIKIASNVEAILQGQLGCSTVAMDTDNPLLLHGAVDPLMGWVTWFKPRDVTTIDIELLCEGSTADTVLRAVVLMEDETLRPSTSVTVSSAFSGEKVLTLTNLGRFEGALFIGIYAVSDEDAAGIVQVKATNITEMAWRYLATDTAVTLTAGTVYKVVPNDSLSAWGTTSLPPVRLHLAQLSVTGPPAAVYGFVWPTYPDSTVNLFNGGGTAPGPIDMDYTPIGSVKVYSVSIKETATNIIAPLVDNFRAGFETAARTLRALAGALEWGVRNRTSVFGCGPATPRAYGSNARPPSGVIVPPTDANGDELTIWSSWTGKYPEIEDANSNSTYLSTINVEGLVGVYGGERSPDEVLLELTLQVEDWDIDSGGTIYQSATMEMLVPVYKADFGIGSPTPANPIGDTPYLRQFRALTYPLPDDPLDDHPCLSLWPYLQYAGGYGRLGLRKYRLSVIDEDTTATYRYVRVLAKLSEDPGSGELIVAPCAVGWLQRRPLA